MAGIVDDADMHVGHGFGDGGLIGKAGCSLAQHGDDLGAIEVEHAQGLGQGLVDGFEQAQGGGGLLFELADLAGGIAGGGSAEGLGQAGGFAQAGHGGFGGFDGFPGQFAQLAGDDVERGAARPELGAFDGGVEADQAHIGLDLLHRLDMAEQGCTVPWTAVATISSLPRSVSQSRSTAAAWRN